MGRRVTAGKWVDAGELRNHLPGEEDREDAEIRPQRAGRDAHAALQEEERRQKRERDDTETFLLDPVPRVVIAHDETEDEGRENSL